MVKRVSSREVTARDDPKQLQMWRGLAMKSWKKKSALEMQSHTKTKISRTGKGLLVWKLKSMETAAKDDPEQVWKDLFKGSVGTDNPCQHRMLWWKELSLKYTVHTLPYTSPRRRHRGSSAMSFLRSTLNQPRYFSQENGLDQLSSSLALGRWCLRCTNDPIFR